METKNIYNLIILDESGSMSRIRRQAVSAMNETFQSIRSAQAENSEGNYFVSLVVFEGDGPDGVRIVRDRVPVEKINDFQEQEYVPGGCTPLYDAMGLSITDLSAHTKDGDAVLVTVITDGMENASRRYNHDAVQRLVSAKREAGWTFAYIGANQDAIEVARDLNIKNALNFDADECGTIQMSKKLKKATEKYYAFACCQDEGCDLGALFDEDES